MDWELALLLIVAAFACGAWMGAALQVYSLLIGVDRRDRTPHKLGRRFYYLVPESEYCRMSATARQPPDGWRGVGGW